MNWLTRLLLFAFLLIGLTGLQALTISPELVKKLQADGKWEEFARKLEGWQKQLDGQTMPFSLAPEKVALGADGVRTLRVVVLLVDFSDNQADSGSVGNLGTAFFDTLLFAQNPTMPRTMTDFYLENSYGNFRIEGDVYGWFRMPLTYAQYVGSGNGMQGSAPNARTMAKDAVVAADPAVNFSLYDNDLDQYVEGVIVVHAGPGAEESGGSNTMWSHQWTINPAWLTNDNVLVSNYLTGPEELYGSPTRIGVYCHEFGHILRLPDLYDVGWDPSRTGVGKWSLMGSGSWNGGGKTPAHFDSWCKNFLDSLYGVFGLTITLTANLQDVVLHSAVSDSVRYRIMLPGGNGKEYFMIDNRQQVGFDRALPGSGLMILHCDDNLTGSNNTKANGHLRVGVEQADGLDHLGNNANEGDGNDLFPGFEGSYTEFTDLTNPSTASFYSTAHQVSVWDVRADTANRTITCNLEKTWSRTNLRTLRTAFSDAKYGNNNQIFDKGERIEFVYTIKNLWKTAQMVSIRLSSSTPGITFGRNKDSLGLISSEQEISNSAAPFDFTISPSITPVNAHFDLQITSADPAATFMTTIYQYVGGVEILLVDRDDDSLGYRDCRSFYTTALDSLGKPYEVWDVSRQGPTASAQYAYEYIIWYTGDNRPDVINSGEVAFLRNYLNGGGNLFLTGQNIAEQLSSTADSTFLRDYLGVRFVSNFMPNDLIGAVGDPVGAGKDLRIRGTDGASNQLSASVLQVLPTANKPYSYKSAAGDTVGPAGSLYAVPGDYRIAFFGFGYEGISSTRLPYDKRLEVMRRVLAFLEDSTATGSDYQFYITENALPDALLGFSYAHQVSAFGGIPPYTWSSLVDLSPLGLSLSEDGLLSGIPAEPGPFQISLRVTDSSDPPATFEAALPLAVKLLHGDLDGSPPITLSDLLFLVKYLYKNGDPPDPVSLADVNCDGVANMVDLIVQINYLFRRGPLPCATLP
jgi:M6 family metalloprotease-like protein